MLQRFLYLSLIVVHQSKEIRLFGFIFCLSKFSTQYFGVPTFLCIFAKEINAYPPLSEYIRLNGFVSLDAWWLFRGISVFIVMKEKEIWKPVKGFEGYYEISNLGRVKSVDRYVNWNGHKRHVKEKIKDTHFDVHGYPCVTLCKDRKSRSYFLHRLLMEAFVPNPENKPFIDHINTDVRDFRLSNLRWVTAKENSNNPLTMQHCRENTYTEERTEKINAKRKALGILIEVYQYTKDGSFVARYDSMHQAQTKTGIYSSQIRTVLNDNTQSAGGYMWFTTKQQNVKYKRRPFKNARTIVEVDESGNEIRRWKMLKDAAKDIGATPDNIRKAINESRKVKGHICKFDI